MNRRQAFGRGGFVAAACVACCAPPIIGALGLTVGLAATAGIFLGIAAAFAVILLGAGWMLARTRRASTGRPAGPVPVALGARASTDALGSDAGR